MAPILDDSRIRAELGVAPEYTMRAGIVEAMELLHSWSGNAALA